MDKIPVKTVPINETLDTNVDQCPDRYNVKRLKGKFALIGSDCLHIENLVDHDEWNQFCKHKAIE